MPGHPDITTIWTDFFAKTIRKPTYRQPFQGFHTYVTITIINESAG